MDSGLLPRFFVLKLNEMISHSMGSLLEFRPQGETLSVELVPSAILYENYGIVGGRSSLVSVKKCVAQEMQGS